MEAQDPVPTARMHWTRLVLGRGHPVIIIFVLAAVGAAICWFSLQRISFLTQTPTRYTMHLEVATEGCDDRRLAMDRDIGSFGPSILQFRLLDDDERPMFVEGCIVRSILLISSPPLQPAGSWRPASEAGAVDDVAELIGVTGMAPGDYMDPGNADLARNPVHFARETFRATIVGGDLRLLVRRPGSTGSEPSFSMRVDERMQPVDTRQPMLRYEVAFHEAWQPTFFTVVFRVPENVRTYFSLSGLQIDAHVPAGQDDAAGGDASETTYSDLDMSVSFRTDEVLLVRGLMSDSGDAVSVGGYLRFGIENSDAESRRESGNVRFSAILGIGIALILEAFVILLALGVRALAARLGIAGKAVVPAD